MSTQSIAAAIERVRSVIRRRPAVAVQADSPALARWQGGLRVVSAHPDGTQIVSDLPREMGGAGQAPTPGWLLRAALASCTAASIVMEAAQQGITLTRLEVRASSVSDIRGMLGMPTETGQPVTAAPVEMQLQVTLSAPGVAPAQLTALVEDCIHRSPVSAGLRETVPVSVHTEIEA
jgi:uncharacterized OsmC-like protein